MTTSPLTMHHNLFKQNDNKPHHSTLIYLCHDVTTFPDEKNKAQAEKSLFLFFWFVVVIPSPSASISQIWNCLKQKKTCEQEEGHLISKDTKIRSQHLVDCSFGIKMSIMVQNAMLGTWRSKI